jgi:hypothetical protein
MRSEMQNIKLCSACNEKPRHKKSCYCKECKKNYDHDFYLKNKQRILLRNRVYTFFNGNSVNGIKSSGWNELDGICWVCGELNPLVLEGHHALTRKYSDFIMTICRNCHILIEHFGNAIIEKGVFFK